MIIHIKKIIITVMCVFLWMFIFGIFQSNAQDNITKHPLISQELTVGNKWPTQFIHDGLLGCFEGTKRWMVLSNPALIGTVPSLASQRKIMIHL